MEGNFDRFSRVCLTFNFDVGANSLIVGIANACPESLAVSTEGEGSDCCAKQSDDAQRATSATNVRENFNPMKLVKWELVFGNFLAVQREVAVVDF